jgi:hypothetical protein
MRWVAHDLEATRAFKTDPTSVLSRYELTAESACALAAVDLAALYASGAHPQLLRRFASAVWPGDRAELAATYSTTVAPYGRPDFST